MNFTTWPFKVLNLHSNDSIIWCHIRDLSLAPDLHINLKLHYPKGLCGIGILAPGLMAGAYIRF